MNRTQKEVIAADILAINKRLDRLTARAERATAAGDVEKAEKAKAVFDKKLDELLVYNRVLYILGYYYQVDEDDNGNTTTVKIIKA